MSPPKALLITGPTASGKSSLAVRIARKLGGIIINADAMQCYQEAPLITAQPDKAERAEIPHHLFGYRPATAKGSVGLWLKDVSALLRCSELEGRLPIFVGGSGLYLEALFRGLATIPAIPEEVRERWAQMRAQEGPGALFRSLLDGDPESATAIGPHDPQRLQRALEVMETTNRSLISFQQEKAEPLFEREEVLAVVNNRPRPELYQRIDLRFDQMMEQGAREEVEKLSHLALTRDHPLARAIGYPQLKAYLSGELSREAAISQAKRDSRRYAKRQLTWYRNRFSDWLWLEEGNPDWRADQIVTAFQAHKNEDQAS